MNATGQQLVWDPPVRVVHWLLVACIAGAWLTAESAPLAQVHVTLGSTAGGLAAFRILWGLAGTRHARFRAFVRGPAAALRYLRSLPSGRPEPHAGHNPAGAFAIVGLLLLAVLVPASGWAFNAGLAGRWMKEVHEVLADALLLLAGVHVAGVVLGSLLHHENLVRAMVTGRKRAAPQDATRRAWWAVAVLVLAAVLGWWWLEATSPPLPANPAAFRHR